MRVSIAVLAVLALLGVCRADEIKLSSAVVVPVSFSVPQNDIHHKWSTRQEAAELPPDWKSKATSRLCSGMPLASFLNANDRNRLLVAANEAKRTVVIGSGLREEDCHIVAADVVSAGIHDVSCPVSDYLLIGK